MATLYIQRLNSANPPLAIITFTIDTFDNFSIDYDMPASLLALPQGKDTDAIAVKVDGNTSFTTISWTMRDLTSGTNPVSGSDASVVGLSAKTILQQLHFFDSILQNSTIDQKFRIQINDPNAGDVFKKDGNIVKSRFIMTSNAPLTFQADVTLQTGNVIAAYNSDVPQPPTSVTTASSVAGQVVVTWTDSADHGSQAVTTHRIQYQTGASDWVDAPNAASSPSTVTGLTSGSAYMFRVSTLSSKGGSDWTYANAWVTVT